MRSALLLEELEPWPIWTLHEVAFPTLDDVHVAALGKLGARRVLRDGEHVCTPEIVSTNSSSSSEARCEIVEHSTGETKRVDIA